MPDSNRTRVNLRVIAHACFCSLACALILLLMASIAYSAGALPLTTLGYASSAISFISAAALGFAVACRQKEKRLLYALICDAVMLLLCLAAGFLVGGKLNKSALLSVVCFTIAGTLTGCMIPVHRKKAKRIRLSH